jgi:uncharacterized protein (TIGR03437 family)
LPQIVSTTAVTIAGLPTTVAYAGAAPYLSAGTFQVNAKIPENAPLGEHPVIVTIGSVPSAARTTIFIR